MRTAILGFLFFISITLSFAQEMNSETLLEKSIAYHDPGGFWPTFEGAFQVKMQRPDGRERLSTIRLNFPKQFFHLFVEQGGTNTTYQIDKENCTLLHNGNASFDTETQEKFRLRCDYANKMKNYYTYLYGLPMKLRDPGTQISPKVNRKTFQGKTYWVMEVLYDESVGSDQWYFYFDLETFALKAYQFYHDTEKNDGEYVVLAEEETIAGIKMPKKRAWYYNTEGIYLGTDILIPLAKE